MTISRGDITGRFVTHITSATLSFLFTTLDPQHPLEICGTTFDVFSAVKVVAIFSHRFFNRSLSQYGRR
jgi:hypothetical protein